MWRHRDHEPHAFDAAIVDLDGAKAGAAIQADLVGRMAKAAGIPCQVGGGIRSLETAAAYLAAGLSRVIVGSVAKWMPL